tara:strand:+ start:622 stop:861 length:240 start_codon:yes stop_codon:yes gene_type:complete
MKEITKKDMTSSIGLILMFALGWIVSGLVDNISCDDCKTNDRIQQRMERMNQPRQQFDFERESQRFQRRQRDTQVIPNG